MTQANFRAGPGTSLSNYALPASATGAGTISSATPNVTVNQNPLIINAGTSWPTASSAAQPQWTVNGKTGVNVPGTFTFNAAGHHCPYSSSLYTENVTFTPTGSGRHELHNRPGPHFRFMPWGHCRSPAFHPARLLPARRSPSQTLERARRQRQRVFGATRQFHHRQHSRRQHRHQLRARRPSGG